MASRRAVVLVFTLLGCGTNVEPTAASDEDPKGKPEGTTPTEKARDPSTAPAPALAAPVKLQLPTVEGKEDVGPIAAAIWIGSDGIAVAATLDPKDAKVIVPLAGGALTPEVQTATEETLGILMPVRDRLHELTEKHGSDKNVLAADGTEGDRSR